jgi:hypothetical protein
MGKKRTRKKYVSKGLRVSHNGRIHADSAQRLAFKIAAWEKGQPVKLTVPNPNKSETNKPFIRVRADDYWGPYVIKKKNPN